MSLARRGQHWGTFARIWHIYNAMWQDPYKSANLLTTYLLGLRKPIYHPMNYCGDHVVVINSKDIALCGDEWRKRVYFHHNTYHRGDTWTLAWELHKKDPTLIVEKAVYRALPKSLQRRNHMQRLHIFPDDKVPADMLKNVCSEIKQLRPVPVRLDHIPQEERDSFPQIISYPQDYILK